MNRKLISLVFSLILTLSVVGPAIMHAFNNSKETLVINLTEEESKENETLKDFKINFLEVSNFCSSSFFNFKKNNFNFNNSDYTNVCISVLSPPPEYI